MNRSFEIYKTVESIIKKYDTRNLTELVSACKIKLYFSNTLGTVLGLYTYNWKNRIIILNDSLDDRQKQLVLAHEMGHDALHRHLPQKKFYSDKMLFDSLNTAEYEANIFAAHLLLNTDDIIQSSMANNGDIEKIAADFDQNINLILIKIRELRKLGFPVAEPYAADDNFLKKESVEDKTFNIA